MSDTVVIAGASGFLGTRLRDNLVLAGHDVTALVRREPGPGQARWDPYAGVLDPALVEGTDAVINLAGAPTLGNPHSKKWAHELLESRVVTTRVLAEAIATSARRPAERWLRMRASMTRKEIRDPASRTKKTPASITKRERE